MKIRLLKLADKVAGKVVAALLPAPEKRVVPDPRRLLVIRPGGIGDAVLLVPALEALKRKFPGAVLTVLAEKRNGAVFRLCPTVDRVLLYDLPADLLKALRGSYDVVIDTEQWHRLSAVVARLCRAPLSIGFGTNERSRLFTHPVSYSHDDYELDSFFHLLAPLEIDTPRLQSPFLEIPEEAARRAAELLAPLGTKRFVVVFPGASIRERQWGAKRFHEVAKRLGSFDFAVVVVGGEEDQREGEIIVSGLSGLNLAGRCSLSESAAVIKRCAVLLSGDSGVLHLGVGVGRPTVSLFGSGIQSKWGPKGEDHIVLNRNLPCSPCTRFGNTPPCREKARCLSSITVDEVAAALRRLLRLQKP